MNGLGRLHPALRELLVFQGRARLRRIAGAFATPRRALLSTLALTLALVWLSNAILSVIYREPYDPAALRRWLPLVPLLYVAWHLLKTAWRRPDEAFEWTPAERELVCCGPFTLRDQVLYRVAVMLTATLLKAVCATLLLLPDLTIASTGFLGILLGLAFADLIRMCIDVAAAGCGQRAYDMLRGGIAAGATALVVSAILATPDVQSISTDSAGITGSLTWLMAFLRGAGRLLDTPLGQLAQAPFQVFAELVIARSLTLALITNACIATTITVGLVPVAVLLHERFGRLEPRFELVCRVAAAEAAPHSAVNLLDRIPRLRGIGPIAWRQILGVHQHAAALLLALTAPALLSCLPLMQRLAPVPTMTYVAAALAFYSLLLLPAALKFDFRRDVERLGALKILPIRPLHVAVGQLAAPVLVASGFQLTILVVAYVMRPVPVAYLLGLIAFLVPLNVLIFAMENTIFLLYPYRLNQEGLEIFLRTTLTFTAKSLLFAVALVIVYLLSQAARDIAEAPLLRPILHGNHRAAFGITMWCAVTLSAAMFTGLLARVYHRHDACLDRVA
jgi:hypothetical protein